MAKNWIKGAIHHPGAFSAKAQGQKMSVNEYAHHVLSAHSTASEQTKRQAQLALTLEKMHHKG